MRYVYEDHYPIFKCVASKCPDSCCRGWEIIIDPSTYAKYKDSDTKFGKKILSHIKIDDELDAVFIQKNGRCPFLNEQNLCDIIINEGDDALCEVCRQHPRFVEEYGDTTEISLSLSCPAVIDILKNKTTPTSYIESTDNIPPEYETDDPEFMNALFKLRRIIFKIIESRSVTESEKTIYYLAMKFQNMIDNDDFSSVDNLKPKITDIKSYDFHTVLSALEILTDEWRDVLNWENTDAEIIDENSIFIKNILSYFVYRYIPKAINDGDIVSKAEFIIFSVKAILHFASRNKGYDNQDEKIAYVARLYSKEIEHDPDNIEQITNSV